MRKLFILLLTFFNIAVLAQNAYYDALYLSRFGGVNKETDKFTLYYNKAKSMEVLDKYVEPNKKNSSNEIFKALLGNPFLSLSYENIRFEERDENYDSLNRFNKRLYSINRDITFLNKDIESYSFKKIPPPEVSTLTQAANIFKSLIVIPKIFEYVENKVEFSRNHLTFLKIFREDFASDTSLKILFPKTTNLLDILDEEFFEINSYYNHLRIAFYEDFTALNSSVQYYINSPFFYELIREQHGGENARKELLQALKNGFYLSKIISYNDNPADVYASLTNNNFGRVVQNDVFAMIGEFSRGLRSADSNSLWINEIQLRDLLESENQYHIFMGLIYEQLKSTSFTLEYFHKKDNILEKLKPKLFDIVHKQQGVQQFYDDIYIIDSISFEHRREYFFRLTEVMLSYLELAFVLKPDSKNRAYIENFKMFSSYFNNIYITTSSKKYIEASTLIATLLNDDLIASNSSKRSAKAILKYGGFMAGFINASNSEEVNDVLDKYVFPIKRPKSIARKSMLLVSIDAYAGLFCGYKLGRGEKKYTVAAGATIPVGINISSALRKNYKKRVSLFIPVVDVGAVNVINFSKDTVATSVFSIENMLSPGIHVTYNRFLGLPVSIMVGVQKSPNTFLSNDAVTRVSDGSLRLRLSFTYNIPLYTIYAKK